MFRMTMTLSSPPAALGMVPAPDSEDPSVQRGDAVDPRWRAIEARDKRWDGAFVFAVSSTRIYCRPSCPSRRPRADRVAFYPDGPAAVAAGYRACKRCKPDVTVADATSVAVIRALTLLDTREDAVVLDELAEQVGLSRSHLQRAFTALVGCSPHEWQMARRAERMRAALRDGDDVSRAALDAGFESLPSAYTAAAKHLGMTPGAYRRGAQGETVYHTVVSCTLGYALVAMTSRGVCRVILGDDPASLRAMLQEEFFAATLIADDVAVREVAQAVVNAASGAAMATPLPLDLRGTAFQQRVWRELTRIPRGETITYAELARRVGSPGAVRAVGSACGANPAAVVVPCHRVLRSDGALGGYRWGLERKAALLEAERE
jgi:AraC family transcriptional regulator of adaptative response/methylated-DNA-[protein]-cysteine methyltransferase